MCGDQGKRACRYGQGGACPLYQLLEFSKGAPAVLRKFHRDGGVFSFFFKRSNHLKSLQSSCREAPNKISAINTNGGPCVLISSQGNRIKENAETLFFSFLRMIKLGYASRAAVPLGKKGRQSPPGKEEGEPYDGGASPRR